MKPILVVYATREGHTRKIAEHIAATLRDSGASAQLVDAANPPEPLEIESYAGAILAASVHVGKHEREMREFVTQHKAQLAQIPTVFLSSSLSQAGAEDPQRAPELRDHAKADVARMIAEFFAETGWRAGTVKPIAGALLYTQYGWLVRFIMKRIAQKEGGSTDTSRDHEYTDWGALDQFLADLVQSSFQPRSLSVVSA